MKNRNSAFELLRVIAMFLIVLYHSNFWGPLNEYSGFSVNYFASQLFLSGGKLGVDLFLLITGYFSVNSKFNVKKIITLWLQVFTYSVAFFLIFLVVNRGKFEIKSLLRSFFPLVFNEYWFATAYVILMFFMPFMNRLIHILNKKDFQRLVAVSVVVTSILPSIFLNQTVTGDLSWFVLLYFCAAYLRVYGVPKLLEKKKTFYGVMGALLFLLISSILVIDILAKKFTSFQGKALHFAGQQSIILLLIAVLILIGVSSMKPYSNKLINRFATCTFGVYLIHDNEFIRPLLWQIVVPEKAFFQSVYFPVLMILSVLGVYCVAMMIEYIRQLLFNQIHRAIR